MAVEANECFKRAVTQTEYSANKCVYSSEIQGNLMEGTEKTTISSLRDSEGYVGDERCRRIKEARHEFFNGRQILIGHLPRDTTETVILLLIQ